VAGGHPDALARVLRQFGRAYLQTHVLSAAQARAWRAILTCRTAAAGGARLRCEGCGREQVRFHSCRNRHCPQCQTRTKEQWLAARTREVLPVPYVHLVFTLPHALNALAAAHSRWVYDTLFASAAATLEAFAANPRWLGAQCAVTLVLHTWTQDLRRHVHLHALVTAGGLDAHGGWVEPPRRGFVFPVRALSKVFRGKFVAALNHACAHGRLPRDPAAHAQAQAQRRAALYAHDWVVYAKAPLGGAPAVLGYLARYTHRTAVSNERILGIDAGGVRLRVRDAERAGKKKVVRLDGVQFVGRFLQHVLPRGFKRIRHYGLLASAHKHARLSAARRALHQPPPQPLALEQAAAFMRRVAAIDILRCPSCRAGRLQCVAVLLPQRHTAACAPAPRHCRAPP
jgi:hypothetical protein